MLSWLLNGCSGGGGGGGSGGASLLCERSQDRNPWGQQLCSAFHSTHTHTHLFNGLFSGTTQVSRNQKGKTNLDFTEARDSEWQWHQVGHMQVCTSLQTDNQANTPPLSFLQAGCPSCHPTNSVNALEDTAFHPAWYNNVFVVKSSVICKERKCGGTSASRDLNGQVDVWR